jgi:biopolymer transport protein ExbB
MNEILNQMWHTYATAGWVILPLVLIAFIAYATAFHLMISLYHRGLKKASDATLHQWVANPERSPVKIRELIRYTQDEVHSLKDIEGRFREVEASKIPDADRRLAFLNIIVVSAPLFGLLGTVLGMLLTFKAIGVGGSSTSEVIASGISEALVCTQTGMMVAIPGLVMAFIAKRWRNEFVAFLTRLEGVSLRHFRPEFHGMTRFFVRKTSETVASSDSAPTLRPTEAVPV